MKIRLSQLRKIIREEVQRNLLEADGSERRLGYLPGTSSGYSRNNANVKKSGNETSYTFDDVDDATAHEILDAIEQINDEAPAAKQIMKISRVGKKLSVTGGKNEIEKLISIVDGGLLGGDDIAHTRSLSAALSKR